MSPERGSSFYLEEGSKIAEDLDTAMRSGVSFGQIFQDKTLVIPDPDEWHPEFPLTHHQKQHYLGSRFLTGYFRGIPTRSIDEEVFRLQTFFSDWRSIAVCGEYTRERNWPIINDLTINSLLAAANFEVARLHVAFVGDEYLYAKTDYWLNVGNVCRVAVST